MKEFLEFLYKDKACSSQFAVDEVFTVIPRLGREKKFDILDNILRDIEADRVDGGVLYALINRVHFYASKLPNYKSFYFKVREEFARNSKSSKEIAALLDKYEVEDIKVYENPQDEPEELPRLSLEEQHSLLLDQKIDWAKSIGDQDLVKLLQYYKSMRLSRQERMDKYYQLRRDIGHEEVRVRSIKALKEITEKLEKGTSGWPGIYYVSLPKDPFMDKEIMDGMEIVVSYPWGG